MDALVYYLDNRAPKISRRLSTQGGPPFDITGDHAFRLRVRPKWSDTLVIDAAMTADVDRDSVEYLPQEGDFDTEGIYRAWIQLSTSGILQDTDEFEIHVFAHTPGEGARVGAIWRAARGLAPVAWDAVRGIDGYGDPELQRAIELAKVRVLKTSVTAAQEDSLDPRVVDYLAKKVLVDNVLEAAINFWTSVMVSQSAQGNSGEVKTYPDRIRAAEEQIKRFRAALEGQAGELTEILGGTVGTRAPAPILINGGLPITPGLEELPTTMRPQRWPSWWVTNS